MRHYTEISIGDAHLSWHALCRLEQQNAEALTAWQVQNELRGQLAGMQAEAAQHASLARDSAAALQALQVRLPMLLTVKYNMELQAWIIG